MLNDMLELHDWTIGFCDFINIPSFVTGVVVGKDSKDKPIKVVVDKDVTFIDLATGIVLTDDDFVFKLTGKGRKSITSRYIDIKELQESFEIPPTQV